MLEEIIKRDLGKLLLKLGTGKDDATGNLITNQYTVTGPVMLMLTTTAIDVDEELLNRCLVLTINESREQTEAIHAAERINDFSTACWPTLKNRRLLACISTPSG